MANITKHNTELERKSNDGEKPWVNFSIFWDSVRIDNYLEPMREDVCLEESWRL